jgi:DUF1680 family protein
MIQETDYPWSGDLVITVNPKAARTFSIRIRVPNREVSEIYSNTPKANGILFIKLNGKLIKPPVEKGYAVIERTWKTGDKIEVQLPMSIQRVKAIDEVEATRGQVALRYGPLVYSVEAVDQRLDNALPPDARLTAEWRPDLLQGVMTIKGKWADGSDFLAIPNYARANRLNSESTSPGAAVGGGGRQRHEVSSQVWLKDQ